MCLYDEVKEVYEDLWGVERRYIKWVDLIWWINFVWIWFGVIVLVILRDCV